MLRTNVACLVSAVTHYRRPMVDVCVGSLRLRQLQTALIHSGLCTLLSLVQCLLSLMRPGHGIRCRLRLRADMMARDMKKIRLQVEKCRRQLATAVKTSTPCSVVTQIQELTKCRFFGDDCHLLVLLKTTVL